MIKQIGILIRDSHKKTNSFLRHHFSYILIEWVREIFLLLALFCPFLLPIYQKQNSYYLKMIDKSKDALFTKSFDGSDNMQSYFSLLCFDVIVCVLLLIGFLILGGLGYMVSELIIYTTYGFNGMQIDTNTYYQCFFAFVPFGVVALVVLFIACMFLEVGGYLASKNPTMGTGDIFHNTLKTLKKIGGRYLLLNLCYFLVLAIDGALIGLFAMLLMTSTNNMVGQFFAGLGLLFVMAILTILFAPFFILGKKMANYKLVEKEGFYCETEVVFADKKEEDVTDYVVVSSKEEEVDPEVVTFDEDGVQTPKDTEKKG